MSAFKFGFSTNLYDFPVFIKLYILKYFMVYTITKIILRINIYRIRNEIQMVSDMNIKLLWPTSRKILVSQEQLVAGNSSKKNPTTVTTILQRQINLLQSQNNLTKMRPLAPYKSIHLRNSFNSFYFTLITTTDTAGNHSR